MMSHNVLVRSHLALLLAALSFSSGMAQTGNSSRQQQATAASEVLVDSAQRGAYTFLVFHRNLDGATQAMKKALDDRMATSPSPAVVALVPVNDPTQKDLVVKYGAGRAPMPLLVVVAPNGAITGVFPQRFDANAFRSAFVSPCTMHSIKALQDGKLVFICVKPSVEAATSSAIDEFHADPLFMNRMVVLPLVAADAEEKTFLAEMEIGPGQAKGGLTVVMAPPGALVGKFSPGATKDEIAGAIAEAGKCCDDPKCKNHRRAQGKQPQVR